MIVPENRQEPWEIIVPPHEYSLNVIPQVQRCYIFCVHATMFALTPSRCHGPRPSSPRQHHPSSPSRSPQYLAGHFYRMFPLFATVLRLLRPFYRMFRLFPTVLQLLRLTTPFWTPAGGSLERGTREQRPCQSTPAGPCLRLSHNKLVYFLDL